MKKKAVLISGGGAWGAYGGGTLARINNDYSKVVGLSTGALMSPFVALKEWELLKIIYTSINNYDVFDNYWYKPFPMTKKGRIRKYPIIISLLLGHKTITTSNVLRKTIDKHFSEHYFNELKKLNKEVVVGTQNYAQQPSKIHYFSNFNVNYEDFKDWMWCSANFPFFTTLLKKSWRDKRGNFHVGEWSDGGLTDLVGLQQIDGREYKEVDIILHRVKQKDQLEGHLIKNLVDNVNTGLNAMRHDIEFECLSKRIRELNLMGVKVNIYWLPRKLNNNSMYFNEKEMAYWWEEGYETAFDSNRKEVFDPILL